MDAKVYLTPVCARIASQASGGAAYRTWPDEFARKEVAEAWSDKPTFGEPWGRRLTVSELQSISRDDLINLGFGNWDGSLMLIPLWAWNYIADGEQLTSIAGNRVTKGVDEIDLDTRGGAIAFGFSLAA